MRRIITSAFHGPIDREAPTIPPPSGQPGKGDPAFGSRQGSLRGFVPVEPPPRRLNEPRRRAQTAEPVLMYVEV